MPIYAKIWLVDPNFIRSGESPHQGESNGGIFIKFGSLVIKAVLYRPIRIANNCGIADNCEIANIANFRLKNLQISRIP